MIDQKLVDEMAALIENAETSVENWHCRDTNCLNCNYPYCTSSAIAEELLEHYQPKLPENSVVISKEEYEELKYPTTLEADALVKENNDLREKCDHWSNLYYRASKELDQARKQVAKEVLVLLDEMRVKEDGRHQWRENHNYCIKKCKTRIAKEFELTLSPEE